MKPTPAPASRERARRPLPPFRPQVEILEGRLLPGETSWLGPWGLSLDLSDLSNRELASQSLPTSFLEVAAAPTISPADDAATGPERPAAAEEQVAPPQSPADNLNLDFLLDNRDVRRLTVFRQPDVAFSSLDAVRSGLAGTQAMVAAPPAGPAGVVSTFTPVPSSQPVYPAPPLFATAAPTTLNLNPGSLAFEPGSGTLAVRGNTGDNVVQEAFDPHGYLEVSFNGQSHSSDPGAASFDPALTGATAGSLSGLSFGGGGGHNNLTLANQQLAGDFAVSAPGAEVVAEDVAAAGHLTIAASTITVSGALQAGTVTLASTGLTNIETAGAVTAETGSTAGRIDVAAAVFVNTGRLQADGQSGGQIAVTGGNLLNAGSITADGTSGAGGALGITFTGSYIDTAAAVVSANAGATGRGGRVAINGGSTGHFFASGNHQALGATGGTIDLLGQDVVLDAAKVDASGATGGGLVRIGGDFHGGNPVVPNAQTVMVTSSASIKADALSSGSGGRVAVWAEQETEFDGDMSARGGAAGGIGGFIEVSGKGDLAYGGSADAGARSGRTGTLLLDPKNIVIAAAPVGVFPQFDLIDPHATLGGDFGTQVKVLSTGNVVVTNPKDNFGGSNAGAVYVYGGLSGALISSLVGGDANDNLGSDGVTPLSNGNGVVRSSAWNNHRGAVTWVNGATGVSGIASDVNSLVGSNPNDLVGAANLTLVGTSNYVVASAQWNNNSGAVTWADGTIGVRGTISAANSLVGNPGDRVGADGITVLTNGNYVVRSVSWNRGRGAATWESGSRGGNGVISEANSLVGGQDFDDVGSQGIVPLSNGNFLVRSLYWNSIRGAVTWVNGTTGLSGVVSEANSVVGDAPDDYVGITGIFLLANGNYVVASEQWNGGRGASTWGDAATGARGLVSETNSLLGTNPNDLLGDVVPLSNGNYVVRSSDAATWGSGTTGVRGTVSPANSLVGAGGFTAGVTPLTNGNYVVGSPSWNGNRGAATWGSGLTGVTGAISEANSLVGSTTNDQVGGRVFPLNNGNYVVASAFWDGGANDGRGAVTWGNGSTGIEGLVSEANSLVGANHFDYVGGGNVTPLSNGNYVVGSPSWNGGRGAATWGSGTTGVTGVVSEVNSLVGSYPNDQVGSAFQITALSDGNYVVRSGNWNGGRGAATWGSGTAGVTGAVTEANSLVGSNGGDQVGFQFTTLSNGNYVVLSWMWNGQRGAATWGNAATGVTGVVSEANSLVGSNPYDQVGFGAITSLANGNYVLQSWQWNTRLGAVTWANGATGITGVVSAANSLVGSNPFDQVGVGTLTPLPNGNYLVQSRFWNNNRGAETWGSGQAGVQGTVSDANSLVGSDPYDFVGEGGVTILSDGGYLVRSPSWNGNRGALTWLSEATGQTLDGMGVVTTQNSLVGRTVNAGLGAVVVDPIHDSFLAPFISENSGRVTAGLADPSQLTYSRDAAQTVTLTPDFLTATLDTGTAVVLQASNDITVNDPIIVNAGGHGGALTLQAGRSIVLNAGITTDNGPLTLIANDTAADGVVDAQRDPGTAFITMAGGTALDTGTAPLDVELRSGAGLTHPDSRAINLQAVTAGTVTVANNGPDAGSDVRLGPVTSSGPQRYSSRNGITTVAGDLSSNDQSVTFTDSVVVNDDVAVDTGSGTVYFAGSGTQTLRAGADSTFANVDHTGSGTLQLAGGLTATGTFIQAAGVFDANDQSVSVRGSAVLTGGTYLAATAPQTFGGGLVITDGTFTSSSGPFAVAGGVTLTGGTLSGDGTLDALTAYRGTVAPGTDHPGVLTVAGAVGFDPLTTLTVQLDGTEPGTGYSQLQGGGPVNLGGSALNLVLGFDPPVGSTFAIVTTADPAGVAGAFAGMPEGAVFTQGGDRFQITYHGGDAGTSVVLTRLASPGRSPLEQ